MSSLSVKPNLSQQSTAPASHESSEAMIDGVSITTLKPGQAALLEELLSVYAEAFEDSRSYASAPPSAAYLERLLAKETFVTVLASHAGRVVGGLVAYVLEKFEQERSEIYIYDLAVLESHRRRGIATALLRQLQHIASERGAYVIFVQADLEDAPAIALYNKLGLIETVHHFDIPVPALGKRITG